MQKIDFGYDAHHGFSDFLKRFSVKNVFLVMDKNAWNASGAEDIFLPFFKDVHLSVFDDFSVNPRIEDITQAVEQIRTNRADAVIGFGGGSAMDIAKAAAVLSKQSGNPEEMVKTNRLSVPESMPLLLVPTTAGTGSESTHFAVIYIDKNKYSLAHDSMLADHVILNPVFTLKLPPYITACSGMDALAQSMESYWSVHSTDESLSLAEKGMKQVLANIKSAVNSPDKENKKAMLQASNWAGQAINITKTTAPHAASYPLTSYFNIPHGHAVGVLLGPFIDFNQNVTGKNCNDSRGPEYVRARIEEINNMLRDHTGLEGCAAVYALMGEIGLKIKLADLGVRTTDDIELIAAGGLTPGRAGNNPRKVEQDQLRALLLKQGGC